MSSQGSLVSRQTVRDVIVGDLERRPCQAHRVVRGRCDAPLGAELVEPLSRVLLLPTKQRSARVRPRRDLGAISAHRLPLTCRVGGCSAAEALESAEGEHCTEERLVTHHLFCLRARQRLSRLRPHGARYAQAQLASDGRGWRAEHAG